MPPTAEFAPYLTIRQRRFEHSDVEWHDVLDRDSSDVPYVETFWLPQLGPTSLLMLRRTAQLLAGADEVTVPRSLLSAGLGVNPTTGPRSIFARTVTRLERFGLVYMSPDSEVFYALTRVPRLSARQVDRLPDPLPVLHQQYIAELRARSDSVMANTLPAPQITVSGSGVAPTHHERTIA